MMFSIVYIFSMQRIKIFLQVFLLSVYSFNAQSRPSLEGQWKIVDITIIDSHGKNWSEDMEELDMMSDENYVSFTHDQKIEVVGANHKNPLVYLQNTSWESLDTKNNGVIGFKTDQNAKHYDEIFEIVYWSKDKVFLIRDDFVIQLKKIKNFDQGNTFILEHEPYHSTKSNEYSANAFETCRFEDLDTLPLPEICFNIEKKNYLECFSSVTRFFILRHIDYSLVKGHVEINLEFSIDKEGKTKNVKVNSSVSDIDKLIKSALENQPVFKPGIKNNVEVGTTYSSSFNLISQ